MADSLTPQGIASQDRIRRRRSPSRRNPDDFMKKRRRNRVVAGGWALGVFPSVFPAVRGEDQAKPAPSGSRAKSYNPLIAPASDAAKQAMRSFRVPGGLKVELFAAEPLLAN